MSTTTRKGPQRRLPAPAGLPDRRVEVAIGIAAFIGTALVVVGLPVLLYAAFGTPWPDESPRLEWLTEPASMDVVLGVLAVVVWLAWAHFVLCLVVEVVAERRHRGLAPHVPGGGIGTQTLARRAVATILLIASTSAVGVGTASAASAPAQDGSNAAQSVSATTVPGPAHAVDAASSRVAQGLPTLGQLDRATKADVAQGVTTYYDVKPPNGRRYDTLWDISERYLGDGLRYKEIWELNKDVTQPDGRQLRNADLIYPGWVMKLPNDARGAGLKVVDHALGGTHATPAPSTTAPAALQDAASGVEAGQASAAATVSEDGGLLPGGAWSPFFGVTGGLALAGAVLGLRRRQASYSLAELWGARTSRGPRPDPLDPTPDGDGAGTRLRGEADVTTATWLDRALRSWNGSAPLPAPTAVSLGAAGLAVALEEEPRCATPAGWTSRGPKVWAVARDAALTGTGPAPLPGLVTVGRDDDGAAVLVDPESVRGIVAVEGPDVQARGLAMSMAVDTGTHPWADDRLVTLVGFADDLASVGQGRIRRTSDLGRVLERLENLATFQRRACREAGAATVRDARGLRPDLDWTYHLVLCSGVPSPDEVRALAALAADPQVSLGVVVIGSVPDAGLRLTTRADGRVVSPLVGVDVVAQVLDVQAGKDLAALYDVPASSAQLSLDDLVDVLEGGTPATDAVVDLGILGPVAVDAPGEVDPDRRAFLTELGCFIALHPTGVHVNRISAALWPRGVDAEVRDAALRQLVSWWGTAADGTPVLAESSGVWSVSPGTLSLDWDRFREALNRAAHDGRQRERHLRSALDQVRGVTLEGVPAGRYGWVAATTLEADTALAVAMTAQALAESAVARGDLAAARTSLDRGLELLPANEDLWRARLQLEAATDDREQLRAVADRLYAAVGEHGSPLGASPQTDSLVDELIPGYRNRAA